MYDLSLDELVDALRGIDVVTRFAPSPNGYLHAGHAYSALLGYALARATKGQFLLRIEDIDLGRARPHFIEAIDEDLRWLGVDWDGDVWQQSARFAQYETALQALRAMGVVYPCWATRTEINTAIEEKGGRAKWPIDPDGAPLYPQLYKNISEQKRRALMREGRPYAWRLDMARAEIMAREKIGDAPSFTDYRTTPAQEIEVSGAGFGDVVIARKDLPTSYHLSVVIDDAAQGVSLVVRGTDLLAATHIHRILQILLDLPAPHYLHHKLLRLADGRRLSKRAGDTGIREARAKGISADAFRADLPPPIGTCISGQWATL